MTPHPIQTADLAALHALNETHAVELSSMTRQAFDAHIANATYVRAVGDAALLITFDETAQYANPNFQWFRQTYPRFCYVDRVVVGAAARGRGLARRLYEDLYDYARNAGHSRVVAEINSDPPNPGSDAFHLGMGFETVGEAFLKDRGKSVRYVARTL